MHDNLIQYINKHLIDKLTAEDEKFMIEIFKVKKIRKHQFYLQEGEVSTQFGFITKGALKQYIVDETGKENIVGLYIENWWVSDRESFALNTPSPYYIDAFEETE